MEAYQKAVTGPRQSPLKTAETNRKDRGGEWHNRVASMANEVGCQRL